ncbi:Ldh family oxidoreductase [Dehalococcoidia bacterium]|nr:Ldh family oxidoreductase [Dehalococcoidia bacterium]
MVSTHQDDGIQLVRVDAEVIKAFAVQCLIKVGVPSEEAVIATDVLVESDLRGIESHGAPRFRQLYIGGIKDGKINAKPKIRVIQQSASTALMDGDGGLGMVVGHRAMKTAIEKATHSGAGFVAVTNSRHFGIAGYYACMALEYDMIGISMTNTTPLMVPTYGSKAMIGSNPISFAAPTKRGSPFVLDIATSLVSAGKFEVAIRKSEEIPQGWGMGRNDQPTTDPVEARNTRKFFPLGGQPNMASHKGYGLGVMVDILSGVLSGAGASVALQGTSGHFFGALRIDSFRSVDDFKDMMDGMCDDLRATPTLPGYDRVLVPGDKEFEAKEDRLRNGIPLYPDVVESLRMLSAELAIPLEL